MLWILVLFENYFHRDTLHYLHVIPCRILRRQQTETRAGRAAEAVDVSVEIVIKGVDMDLYGLSDAHLFKLGLLEVGGYVNVIEVDESGERLSRLNDLAYFHRTLTHDPVCWSHYRRVLEIQFRL